MDAGMKGQMTDGITDWVALIAENQATIAVMIFVQIYASCA
tara:strand:+ start:2003 stop:2125 length:123 start_codon:yes stop_codon:yes gene_type:complete